MSEWSSTNFESTAEKIGERRTDHKAKAKARAHRKAVKRHKRDH